MSKTTVSSNCALHWAPEMADECSAGAQPHFAPASPGAIHAGASERER